MTPERVEELFAASLELTGAARAEFLNRQCGEDLEVIQRLQTMLEAHDRAEKMEFFPAHIREVPGEKPGDLIGVYRLCEKIGEGGWGNVYLAEQQEPVTRRVALKVIKPGMDSRNVIARFDAERQALARMDHPNIARVLDAGATAAGRPYFVMELVCGIPITECCNNRELSICGRLELFVKVCQAIQHAHQKGVIHRDLKPTNILVTECDGVLLPKVIDFGVAKATEGRLTSYTAYTGGQQFIGTPAYMSPEQTATNQSDIDTRTDIYSLGVILYELLCGETPFDSRKLAETGLEEMCRIIRQQEPPRPSVLLGNLMPDEQAGRARHRNTDPAKLVHLLRGDLDWMVMKCLEKERDRRYETVSGLATDLRRHLTGEPVSARPPSTVYRFQKLVRRNRLLFGAGAAVFCALLVGLVVSEREAARATKAETAALRNLYTVNMDLAQAAAQGENVARLRELLEESANYAEHGFEWYYWQRQTHLALTTLTGHVGPVTTVAISADGELVATGSEDRTVVIWERKTGRLLFTLRGHAAPIRSVGFSPDARRLVSGSADQTARVWDLATGRSVLTLIGHVSAVLGAEFSNDGKTVVTTGADVRRLTWDAQDGRQLYATVEPANGPVAEPVATNVPMWKGHTGRVNAVGVSTDGRWMVSGSSDGTAKIWENTTREALYLKGRGAQRAIFSPDGRQLCTDASWVWDSANCQEMFPLEKPDWRSSFAYSPDSRRIAAATWGSMVLLWDARTGTRIGEFGWGMRPVVAKPDRRIDTRFMCLSFSSDGTQVLTGEEDNRTTIWDLETGREVRTLAGHSGPVRALACSADRQWILTGSDDHTAILWAAREGVPQAVLKGHAAAVTAVAFPLDSKRILTGSEDNLGMIWNVGESKPAVLLRGHSAPIQTVGFSPDGHRVLTSGQDEVTRLWESQTGKELLRLPGGWGVFSPDGRRIATGGPAGVRVWEAATVEDVAVWQNQERTDAARIQKLKAQFLEQEERDRQLRGQGIGCIKDWIVMLPVPVDAHLADAAALGQQQIPGEAMLKPIPGQCVNVQTTQLTWQSTHLKSYELDFSELMGRVMSESAIAYAVAYIQSPRERREVVMRVGSDDCARIYLNGRLVHQSPQSHWFQADQDVVAGVTLHQGTNTLVFKVFNVKGRWRGSIRFTDVDGKPLEGVTTSAGLGQQQ